MGIVKGKLEAFNVAFENNTAGLNSGGVVCVSNGAEAFFENVTFTGNLALNGNGFGGVINGAGAGTRITVKRSVASGNKAIWGSFAHLELGSVLLLENSTLYNNSASTAGALASPGGHYTLRNTTIVGNRSESSASGGIFLYNEDAEYTLINSLVAANTDKNGNQNNCSRQNITNGTLISMGGNVFGDSAGDCNNGFRSASDLLNAELKLDPTGLADNGGPTQTVAIQPGSAAQDRGQSCPPVDQRGVARSGAKCDAGAFELKE
jgi:hypothetical protein